MLVFAAYPLLRLFMAPKDAAGITVFLGGFAWSLHIVFSAKSLRSRQGDFLKANYAFSFTLIYILDLLLISFLLSLLVDKFSFVGFFQSSFEAARELWIAICKQIFVLS
jgi:membrane protease YdiL (CAAX protease family)